MVVVYLYPIRGPPASGKFHVRVKRKGQRFGAALPIAESVPMVGPSMAFTT